MTATERILLGIVASFLLILGLVRAAESFDPVVSCGRPNCAAADDLAGSTTARLH